MRHGSKKDRNFEGWKKFLMTGLTYNSSFCSVSLFVFKGNEKQWHRTFCVIVTLCAQFINAKVYRMHPYAGY